MSFRGRLRFPRACLLAALALAALVPTPALAGGSGTTHELAGARLKADQVPAPRAQEPGQVAGFRLPIASGRDVRIEQGWNSTFSHNGKNAFAYDFGLDLGTDVLAAAAGVVAFVHDGETACGGPQLLDNANYVTIYHDDGSATLYAHLSTVAVKVGDIVAAGQVIARSGNTGYSRCVPHLHFARQYQGRGVTQSIPVYFIGYPGEQFHTGDVVNAPVAACAGPDADGVVAGALELGSFCGAYFGATFDNPAWFVRRDAMLSFDWRAKGPGGYWLDDAKHGFAARWSGDFVFASAGTYTIGAVWSGAVVISIDGEPLIDRWLDNGAPVEVTAFKALGAGIHRIDVEYLSANGHGMLKLGWGRLLADD
ncbi:MAG TPA: peptidoglycan DD-metalloendopeptidase family protein [Patescibacteria group bacterium]|nr:peptidoglycan DD-metalloendopeptidase family protein [Patescibacteria group bacterium]